MTPESAELLKDSLIYAGRAQLGLQLEREITEIIATAEANSCESSHITDKILVPAQELADTIRQRIRMLALADAAVSAEASRRLRESATIPG